MPIYSKLKTAIKRFYKNKILPLLILPSPKNELMMGSFIGIFIGLTPTEGIQIISLTALWYMTRLFRKLRFNLKLALAVSCISNGFTIIPLYFLFYFTGIKMGYFLWHWTSPVNYNEFVLLIKPVTEKSFPDSIPAILEISKLILAPLFFGSLPYALTFGILAYHLTGRILPKDKNKIPLGKITGAKAFNEDI